MLSTRLLKKIKLNYLGKQIQEDYHLIQTAQIVQTIKGGKKCVQEGGKCKKEGKGWTGGVEENEEGGGAGVGGQS